MRYHIICILFCIIFDFFYNSTRAQEKYDYSCLYSLKYQPDSINKNDIKYTTLILLINGEKKQSLFEPLAQFKYDSAVYANPNNLYTYYGSSESGLPFNKQIRYSIYKKGNKIITEDYVAKDLFGYEETATNFHWTISTDTAIIGGVVCQQAFCSFGNRKWIAWFAPSIPLNDGPYKFCGLPGLIMKIIDSKNYYDFSLISMTHVTITVHKSQTLIPIKVTKQKFFETLLAYDKHPFEKAQVGRYAKTFTSGSEKIKRRLDSLANKDNNWIELYKTNEK